MDVPGDGAARVSEVRASAQGWQRVQLAVLGFIGLCGVLQGDSGAGNPRWLQILAGLLVLVALALSCAAIAVVASVAWPVDVRGHPEQPVPADDELGSPGRRLRLGIVATFVAVAVTALATASSWWPREAAAASGVELTTTAGVACGQLRDAGSGRVALDVGGRRVVVGLADIVRLRPVDRCP